MHNTLLEYAAILNTLEATAATGQVPPPELVQRALAIETQAAAHLSPEQTDLFLDEVNRLRAENKQIVETQQAQRLQVGQTVALAQALRRHTPGMGHEGRGIENLQQFEQVRKGEKYTVRNPKPGLDLQAADEYAKRFGFENAKAMMTEMDNIQHRYVDRPEEAIQRLEKLGLTERDLAVWRRNRPSILMQVRQAEQAKDQPDSYEIQPTPEDQLRADILAAAHEHGADFSRRDVPDDWREGDSVTRAIVDALDEHEATETAAELVETEHAIFANAGSN